MTSRRSQKTSALICLLSALISVSSALISVYGENTKQGNLLLNSKSGNNLVKLYNFSICKKSLKYAKMKVND